MDHFDRTAFPEFFEDYIFTPTFIRNLLKEATFSSKIVILSPQEIYFSRREFESNKTYVETLREKIKSQKKVFSFLDSIIRLGVHLQTEGKLAFTDLLLLEWFRYMHLEVLHREIIKLEYILKQLKINMNVTEAQELIKEVRLIREEAIKMNTRIKNIIKISKLLCIDPDYIRRITS